MITERQADAANDQLIRERSRTFSAITLPIQALFAVAAALDHEWLLLGLLAFAIGITAYTYVALTRGRERPPLLHTGIAVFIVLMLYLVAFPGPNLERALWFFTLPLVTLMLMPPRLGLVWSATAVAAALALMIFGIPGGEPSHYTAGFILRFTITGALLTAGLYWSETSLRRDRNEMTIQRLALESERERLNSEIARRGMLEKELRQQATTDALTGLLNRRAFMERFTSELSRGQRHGPMPTLIILDIDHFKKINDGYGHPAGDAVLVHLAQLLRASLRNVDLVGRIGGEEFALLLIETDSNAAEPVIERLLERIRKTQVRLTDGEVINFTSSIGSTAVQWGDVVDTAIQRADEALYTAKNSGRNRHVRR
ncbi:MAG: diguanylate cyclase [Betaproteobacteria bacterium]|nr:diguanylate cyclase [Betaproteobacteria bacterium]